MILSLFSFSLTISISLFLALVLASHACYSCCPRRPSLSRSLPIHLGKRNSYWGSLEYLTRQWKKKRKKKTRRNLEIEIEIVSVRNYRNSYTNWFEFMYFLQDLLIDGEIYVNGWQFIFSPLFSFFMASGDTRRRVK